MSTYILNGKNTSVIIKKQMYKWFVELKKNLPKYLEKFIMSEFYNQYSPTMYERQYRILSAIMSSDIIETPNGYRLEIYLDPNKVSYDPSIWQYPDGKMFYKKGDDTLTVFNNMSKGIHGFVGDPRPYQTQGRFWEEFLEAIGQGGTYDMFRSFQKYMSNITK